MTDETKTCQVMMANLQPCGRELYQGDVCVCHSDDPEKDVQAFRQEVIRELTPRGKHESDLTKFVFPAETPNMGNREYRLRAFFTGARFLGSISFENSTFKAGARFNDAVFEKRVMFHETTFLHEASFANADFQEGACFTQATFEDTVTFGKAIFAGVAEFHLCKFLGNATFGEVTFDDVAHFLNAEFESKARFEFARFTQDADFSEVKFHQEAIFRYSLFDKTATFSRAIFDGSADFAHREFDGKAWFNDVIFKANVDFTSSRFKSIVYFVKCRFLGAANFSEAKFFGSVADLDLALFGGPTNFIRSQFSGEATFQHCCLTPTARLTFDAETDDGKQGVMFEAVADFRYMRIEKGAELHFRCLSLEKFRFLGTKVEQMEFTDVEWPPRKKRLGRAWLYRKAVYDELSPRKGQSWEQVADIYRGLQEYYHQRNRYQEAGGFYIAEQDINRKVNGKLPYRVSARLYRFASIYGESYLRSLLWLAFVLVLSPAVFLWSGIDLSPHIDPGVGPVDIVSYGLSPWPQDCYFLTGDYWEVFNANISFITLNRTELTSRLPSTGYRALAGLEMVLVVILVSFVVLALRRWFKRKSF